MQAREVQWEPGCHYHLYNRGAHRHRIFYDEEDFEDFLARLKKYARMDQVTILAYCLMPNHFHLLVRQDGPGNAGKVVQLACNGYTQAFNWHHEHDGTLFQGRFQRLLVAKEDYLRHLCRYIHTNPVKDGFVFQPDMWRYSDYLDWIGRRHPPADAAFITEHFGSPQAYAQFVADWPLRKTMPAPLIDHLTRLEREE